MSMTKFHADIRAMSIAIKLRNRARLRLDSSGIYTTSLTAKDPKIDTEINSPSSILSFSSSSSSACSTLVSTPTSPPPIIPFNDKYVTLASHRHHNSKRERSYVTDPTFRWNLQKPVPQLILFWETVSLVGSAIARRCAGWP